MDQMFVDVNWLFFLSSKNGNNPVRDSFDKYGMPYVKINDYEALIDDIPLFVQPVKKQTRSI